MSKTFQPDSLFNITSKHVPRQTYIQNFQPYVRLAEMLRNKIIPQLEEIVNINLPGYDEGNLLEYPQLIAEMNKIKTLYEKMITNFTFHGSGGKNLMSDDEKITLLNEFDKKGPLVMVRVFSSAINKALSLVETSPNNILTSPLFIAARKAENEMLTLHYNIRDNIRDLKKQQFRKNSLACREIIDYEIERFEYYITQYNNFDNGIDIMINILKNMKHFHSCDNNEIKKQEKIALVKYIKRRVNRFITNRINMFKQIQPPDEEYRIYLEGQIERIKSKLISFIDETKRTIRSIQ